jgi:hypothetical protein
VPNCRYCSIKVDSEDYDFIGNKRVYICGQDKCEQDFQEDLIKLDFPEKEKET